MAQPAHLNRNLPGNETSADLGGPFLYRDQDQDGEKASYSLETPYGFQLDLDFLKYVDDIERGQTLRKLPLHRKAKGTKQSLSSSRSQPGGWTSTESLSSTTSEDGKPIFSPRPKMWAVSLESKELVNKQSSLPVSPTPIIHLLPPPSPKNLMRNARVEKTLLETSKRLEEEQLNLLEGGTSSAAKRPSSPSKVTFPQNCSPSSIPLGESLANAVGFGRISPSNSGKSTPATAVSPMHLHHVREQMAAALKQLKELEEQVKTIPVLEMKICKLKREKEELVAGLWEKLEPDTGRECVFNFPPRSPNMSTTSVSEEGFQSSLEIPTEVDHEPDSSKARQSKIVELKKLTEKLSSSDRVAKVGKGAARSSKNEQHMSKSIAVGEEINMNEAVFYYRCQKPCQEVAVGREIETKDAEVWVMESLLGVSSEAEKEIQLLQQTVQHQREVIAMLEGHLKEAAEELEELRVEVCSRIPKNLISKETMAQPEMVEACTEAVPTMQCQAVDGHVQMADKGVLCSPQVVSVGVGCDFPWQDHAPVQCGAKATQVKLEMESKGAKKIDSTAAKLDLSTAGDASRVKDAEVRKRAVIKESNCTKVSLVAQTPRKHPESRLLLQSTAKEEASVTRECATSPVGSTGTLKSIMKKRDGPSRTDAGSGRKSLQFVGVLNGEYESTSSEEEEGQGRPPRKSPPLSSDSDMAGSTGSSDEDLVATLECSDSDAESPVLRVMQNEGKLGCEQEGADEEDDAELALPEVKEKFELSPRMREACLVVRSHLGHGGAASKSKEMLSSSSLVLQEWFRVSSQKSSVASEVAEHLLAFSEISPALVAHVVNLSDGNGNTALHYSVSHSNFDIVQLLLDTGACNVNHQNKAGYTALMLAALAAVEQEDDMAVVRRLFGMGNVNAKASQAGQTALMLAVSHGRQEMVEALLDCGADINLQDEEGSTALMCACEHGRAGTVRLLLSQPACDVSIVDNDGNDAVSIALEASHRDIAALISSHLTQLATPSPVRCKDPQQ
ncbi:KN motif and ankyrin repeat domain-containing protein 3 isoform X2 [Hemicordylus capensis]|uniref:KN motif and ankyrin repeat domain-containing protein 3 isoform X2 n=1 Tax=Hemicordylus capensis TaxID=884348 RepID=UPI00230276BE|nr:KN motif and ankyrin repeat domain-containing protein 3 isoform X2 [Hemicordylus capensis]